MYDLMKKIHDDVVMYPLKNKYHIYRLDNKNYELCIFLKVNRVTKV